MPNRIFRCEPCNKRFTEEVHKNVTQIQCHTCGNLCKIVIHKSRESTKEDHE